MVNYDLTKTELEALEEVQYKLYNQSKDMGWHDTPKRPNPIDIKWNKDSISAADFSKYMETLNVYMSDLESKVKKSAFPVKLMLIVSEVAEAMEGNRKGLIDDHLPHRKMEEVELADAMIRIFDLAGKEGFDLAGAIAEKHAYNRSRADHQKENREKLGGKTY